MYNQLDSNHTQEQAGFRKNFGTTEHILTINQLLEKTNEYQMEIRLLFVDFQKAFDTVNQIYLWDALLNQGVQIKMIKILQEFFKDNKAYIKVDKEGPIFEVPKGVKLGDPLSPNLFNCILEEIFKETNWGIQTQVQI